MFSGAGRGLARKARICGLRASRRTKGKRSPVHARKRHFLASFSYSKAIYFSCTTNGVHVSGRLTLLQRSGAITVSCAVAGRKRRTKLSVAPLVGFQRRDTSSTISSLRFAYRPGAINNFALVPTTTPKLYVRLSYDTNELFPHRGRCSISVRCRARMSGRATKLSARFYPCSLHFALPTRDDARVSLLYAIRPVRSYPILSLPRTSATTVRVTRMRRCCSSLGRRTKCNSSTFTGALIITTSRFLTQHSSAKLVAVLTNLP